MGNQIVCPTGQSWYLSDFEKMDLQVARSLFDGTFMLSFLVNDKKSNSEFVVKCYKIPDNDAQYKDVRAASLEAIGKSQKIFENLVKNKSTLRGNLDIQYFVTNNAAYLVRPYMPLDLVSRMDDFPKLTFYDQLWISYQLVRSVFSLHSHEIYHGAIKPENVLLSDRFEVNLSDHSPYKPDFLRVNQPNFYMHYFSCFGCAYLAPERLIENESSPNIDMYASDYFSLGCVLYYIFTDGNHLFDFGTLVQYKNGEKDFTEKVNKVTDPNMRKLIELLISIDTKDRFSAMQNYQSYFPQWMSIYYDAFFRYGLKDININDIVNVHPNIMAILPKDIGFGSLIYFHILSDCIVDAYYCLHYEQLIDDYVDYSIKFFDDSTKLLRAIPPLFELIEKRTIEAIYAWDGIKRILHTVQNVPEDLANYHTNFILKRLMDVNRKEFSYIYLTDLPLFAIDMVRIFPSFIRDLRTMNYLFVNFVEIPIDRPPSEKTIGAEFVFLDNCKIAGTSGNFDLLELIYLYSLSLIRVEGVLPKLIDVIVSFYENMDLKTRMCFETSLIEPIFAALDSIDYNTPFGAQNILALTNFVKKVPIPREYHPYLFQFASSCASRGSYLDRETSANLIQLLDSTYQMSFFGQFATDLVFETDKEPIDTNKAKKGIRMKYSPSVYCPKERGQWKYKSALFSSSKVDNARIRGIYRSNLTTFVALSGKSTLSKIMVKNTDPKIKIAGVLDYDTNIHSICRLGNNKILFSDTNSLNLMTDLMDIHQIYQTNKTITSMKPIDENTVLIQTNFSNSLEMRDIQTFKLKDEYKLESKILSFDAFENVPFIVIASENNLLLIDERVNLPVWSANINYPCRYVTNVKKSPYGTFICVCDDNAFIYDTSKDTPIIEINGNCQCVASCKNEVYAMNQNGTFVFDSIYPTSSFELFDTKPAKSLPVTKGKDSYFISLPEGYTRGLHGHTSRVTAAWLSDNDDLFVTGDESGVINFWSPKKNKFSIK
ncbi:CAMK family protein kinase [Trichomonas vaginalis G3]|uniref:CAMK family protein kinase n=1 Tax=Trichomonas vaginalis (strain ATCC PRA-98 / G3) TaxID=412133 RepID=A2F741_TRIV3|nr:autophagy of peroxisome [Trichomonas vaginalis G3]EAX99278.1 CAMK family protein kinase [Trichomonas vaginalis G3]KAI5524944.1 autophagy of peroxisome [Trichomonas vaginalis G3]|eukprot:XP_001312208.1 CAMK family protein kinase [Trichomonas vaginalis G3]